MTRMRKGVRDIGTSTDNITPDTAFSFYSYIQVSARSRASVTVRGISMIYRFDVLGMINKRHA